MKSRRTKSGRKKKPQPRTRTLRTVAEFLALPERRQQVLVAVSHVVSTMRADRISLGRAARYHGVSPETVLSVARPALRKSKNGQYAAKKTDRLFRVLVVPGSGGLQEIAVRDSREATKLAKYWDIVDRYLTSGDESGLRHLRYKTLRQANGKRFRLLTDRAELDRLGSAGVLSFESLYARSA